MKIHYFIDGSYIDSIDTNHINESGLNDGGDDDFDSFDLGWAGEECAEDYHTNHDGWESKWPVTFAIYAGELTAKKETKGLNLLGCVTVDREMQPSFNGYVTEE